MFKRASFAVAAALLLVGLVGRAEAVVMIDPGPVGGPSNSPLVSDEFFPGGQTTSFHFVFTDMKHVEATIWGWQLSSDFNPSGPLELSYVYYLTDILGNEIDGTRDEDTGDFGTALTLALAGPIVAHDFFIEFTPNQNILVNVFVDGLVGEWVPLPEPAAITLFGFGLAGLALAGLHGAARQRHRVT